MKKIYLPLVVGLFLVPTILISQTVSISGQITRHNGDPVPDIQVNCDGSVVTDVDGNFEFTDVAQNFSCELTPSGIFDKYEDVTVLDAIVLQREIGQSNNDLNVYQILACDVNNSQSITPIDMVNVFQLALRGNAVVSEDWLFVDADSMTSFPGTISITASDNVTDADFIAIKKGDPAISSDHMPAPAGAPSPKFIISNETFQVGEDVEFEVTVEDFGNIIGFQQSFNWDTNVMQFQFAHGFSGLNVEVNPGQASEGVISTLSPLSMINQPDGNVIMRLKFKVLAEVPNQIEVLSFSDDISERQVIWQNPDDQELFIVEAEYINGEGTTSIVNIPKGLESFEVFPNPAQDDVYVKALLQKSEDYEISIVNVLGQKVYSENFDRKELLLSIGFGEFPAGTYFLSIQTADGILTESFVKN